MRVGKIIDPDCKFYKLKLFLVGDKGGYLPTSAKFSYKKMHFPPKGEKKNRGCIVYAADSESRFEVAAL